MKFLISALCLLSTAAAMPAGPSQARSSACATPNQVSAAIDNYIGDVTQVNGVVDGAPSPDAVKTGFFFEADEPKQLAVLGAVCGPQSATYAADVANVGSATQQVLGAISNIQDGVGAASDTMAAINKARCCIILPGLDRIFSAAAKTVGVTNQVTGVTTPKPNACKTVPSC